MGFRFRRSVKILPGVKLNFSKSGISTSVGGPGATVNFSKRGTRKTVGLPGTGLSFVTQSSNGSSDADVPRPPKGAAKGGQCGCIALVLGLLAIIGIVGSDPPKPSAGSDLPQASGAALQFSDHDTGYVSARSLNGRANPTADGAVIGSVGRGEEVQIVDRSGEWLRIAKAGTMMWIAANYVSPDAPASKPTQSLLRSSPERSTTQSSARWFGKSCKKGKPCGNSCIAANRTCHK